MLELDLDTEDQTRLLGRALASVALPGLVLALDGPLGAGKTLLAKAFVNAISGLPEDDVTSPTFAIAREYEGDPRILHLDAYRLRGPRDLEDLALPLASDRWVVVTEWAARVREALPEDRLEIELRHREPGRGARIRATGPVSRDALEKLSALSAACRPPGAPSRASSATPRGATP